jgi:hypothetical protein
MSVDLPRIHASASDQAISPGEEPPLGSHLVTPRFAFTHHGIYVGGGRVVHYGSLARSRPGGPVQEVTLERFAQGHPVWIRWHALPRFRHLEVIRRARARIGENSYRLLSNNCEHFCEWCLYGEHRSYQVETVLLFPLVARFFRAVLARRQTTPWRFGDEIDRTHVHGD